MKMQSMSSRWLAGIAVVILVIIVLSVAIALVNGPREGDLLPENTPEGTVQRYLLAVEQEESRRAYEYLAPALRERCEFHHFRDSTRRRRWDSNGVDGDLRVTLQGTQPFNGKVEVRVRIKRFQIFNSFYRAPFEPIYDEYSRVHHFMLVQSNGSWRIVDQPWPLEYCFEPHNRPTAVQPEAELETVLEPHITK